MYINKRYRLLMTRYVLFVLIAIGHAVVIQANEVTIFANGFEEPAYTPEQAAHFLNQATFGATLADIVQVQNIGYEAWLDAQINMDASTITTNESAVNADPMLFAYYDFIQNLIPGDDYFGIKLYHNSAWFYRAVTADDALRQRVAFALSQIFVVSDLHGELSFTGSGGSTFVPAPQSAYHDLLVQNAFVNYRTLLEKVTLSQPMGIYLSMMGNAKANPTTGAQPDQNYAREVLQLFSIGLSELNLNGTLLLDNEGHAIETYTQDTIENFARVFTGWNSNEIIKYDQRLLMEAYDARHDFDAKTLLGNEVLPSGQTTEQDLADALDNIFYHPNVGPFMAMALIKQLVSSNPSPEYIARVASVFNDDGTGVRGNLAAVIQVILLDVEARAYYSESADTFGKVREPLVKLVHLYRAMKALPSVYVTNPGCCYATAMLGFSSYDALYPFGNAPWTGVFYSKLGQENMQSPSVFNFYSPFFQQPGEVQNAGLYSPEMQMMTESAVPNMHNELIRHAGAVSNLAYFDTAAELALASNDINALIDRLDLLFLSGQMSTLMHTTLADLLNQTLTPELRLQYAVQLILTSPEYAVQK